MSEPFVIPVIYNNNAVDIQAQLFTTAYSYRIRVLVDDEEVNFERDDEGKFRAVAALPDNKKESKTKPYLLQLIAEKLEEILA